MSENAEKKLVNSYQHQQHAIEHHAGMSHTNIIARNVASVSRQQL